MVEHPDSFVGRTAELAALREVLGDVRSGQPQTVLITGPAGIGKTSLVDQFLLEVDATVLRASGEQWEALVAFGVIDQLLRAAGLSKGLLLAGRNRSLPPEEPVGVGTVLLEALEGLERNAPVVLLVDDAQWADVDSLRALLFALRRLVTGRVLTLLAEREEDAIRLPDGLRRLASGTTGRSLRVDALDSGTSRSSRRRSGSPDCRCAPQSGCGTTPAAARCSCGRCCPRSPWIGGARGSSRCCPRRVPSSPRSSPGCPPAVPRRWPWWRPVRCWVSAPRSTWPQRWPRWTIRWVPSTRRAWSGCCRAPMRSRSGT